MTDKEFDEGLEAIMGDRYKDDTKPIEKPVAKAAPKKKSAPVKKPHAMDIPVESQWQPEKPAPDMMEKLKRITKDVFVFAFISLLLFWWKQTGRLEETTAWYSLIASMGMVFFSIGKHCRGDKR